MPRLRRSLSFTVPALLKEDWTVRHEFLTIDLTPFVKGVFERLCRLIAARALVESSPEILGGTPVIRGTRVPVYHVAAAVSEDMPLARILDDYPSLDREKVELVTLYASANPQRGRPRTLADLQPGAVLISEHRVPRRKKAT